MANLLARFLELPTEYPARRQKVPALGEISTTSSSKSGHNGLSGPVMKANWPPECVEYEIRFGSAYARLFPLLGREVYTPSGRGVLIQVFAQRVAVNISGKIIFLSPEKVLPLRTKRIAVSQNGTRCPKCDFEA
jgi:hypothetical protein